MSKMYDLNKIQSFLEKIDQNLSKEEDIQKVNKESFISLLSEVNGNTENNVKIEFNEGLYNDLLLSCSKINKLEDIFNFSESRNADEQ